MIINAKSIFRGEAKNVRLTLLDLYLFCRNHVDCALVLNKDRVFPLYIGTDVQMYYLLPLRYILFTNFFLHLLSNRSGSLILFVIFFFHHYILTLLCQKSQNGNAHQFLNHKIRKDSRKSSYERLYILYIGRRW